MTSLPLALQQQASWEGSLEDLVSTARAVLHAQGEWQGRSLRAPTRPLVVNYRTVGVISPAVRKRYQWRHLVQLVVACVLVQAGETRQAVARRFQSRSPTELIALLMHPLEAALADSSEPVAVDDALSLTLSHEAIPLLAAGLVEHYRRARSGQPLVHDSNISPHLRAAMRRLASLSVLHGLPVQADGVHALVAKSTEPLRAREWGIPTFDAAEFRFQGIRLIDARSRLPTIECIELARQIASELDLQEQQAFAQLNSVCDQFASRGDEVYMVLREFITRHPVSTASEQKRFLESRNMQLAAPFLASCYESVEPHHLVKGRLWQCLRCSAPMVASVVEGHVACPVRQCKAFESAIRPTAARELSVVDSLVAKAPIQVYWCGPGLDEIALFDTAVSEPPGLAATLYPGRDRCDLSLDGDIVGIDVKSHANPFLLAETLNRGLGRLEFFAKKIIAVNDQALSRFPDYLDILRREFNRSDVEFTSVGALRRRLKDWA